MSPDIVALITFLICWCGVGLYSYGFIYSNNGLQKFYTVFDKFMMIFIAMVGGLLTFLTVLIGGGFENKWRIW